MRDRGQQRRPQSLGFDRAPDAFHVFDEMHALDRQRRLVDQGVEQAPLVRRQDGARLVRVDADHADRAASRAHGQEQALGAGQVLRPATGRAVALPCPFGRRQIGFAQRILRRIACLDGNRTVFGQQQHDAHLQHQRDLIGRRPQHIVQRADAGQLAAEDVERLGRSRPSRRHQCLRAHPGGDVRDERCHQGKEDEGGDVLRIGDGEGVDRRQEEEIVAQGRNHAGHQRRPKAEAQSHGNDCREKQQVDGLDTQPRADQEADAESDCDSNERAQQGRGDRAVAASSRSAPSFLELAPLASSFAGDDVDADVAAAAHQLMHDRAVQDLEPARAARLADDDVGDVVGLRIGDHIVGDATPASRYGDGLALEALRQAQRIGHAIALFLVQLQAARRFRCRARSMARAGDRRGAWRSAPARRRADPR